MPYARKNLATGTPWESTVGYSRAVKMGPFIYVSGTTATDDKGALIGKNEPYAQTLQALKNIEAALIKSGATLKDVVRTRIYVTRIADWKEVGRAHADKFSMIRPATTLVEVKSLVVPEMLVEIEADAVLASG